MDRVKILLSLDDLFDTRLSTALRLNQKKGIDLIKNGIWTPSW
ncbi:hypothetical protein 2050HW_00082 [Serratia phage vB_SmaM_ 2050HW]|uniref:Uncharacterized protein n=1 Tax=Serratia phage vB_SmaM_ 2050HW TaxID=2024252 RepID=A0A289YV85_9CAUD|nr:hypothetical protein HWB23_gp082 [Serratia phage vB_SmaM_ 2050HW]ATA65417.1 hypothetical protein 2050HW_00082 [Serratia phage vB_SmaM_ 2050HW]